MAFNPKLTPYFEACRGGIFNSGCAASMLYACSQPDESILDVGSNCFAWKNYYENEWSANPEYMEKINNGGSSLINFLDQTKRNFCNRNITRAECRCMAFPQRNREQCEENSAFTGCTSINDAGECPGKHFSRYNDSFVFLGKTYSGTFISIDMAACVPFPCWVESCLQNTLKTSDMVNAQLSGECNRGVCISVQGTDTISVQTPSDSSNFTPSSRILAPCGGGIQAPSPDTIQTVFVENVDTLFNVPLVISNNGTSILTLTLEKSFFADWIIAPDTIIIGPQSVVKRNLLVNTDLLKRYYTILSANGAFPIVPTTYVSPYDVNGAPPPNELAAPIFVWKYQNGVSYALFETVVLLQLTPPRTYVNTETTVLKTPAYLYYLVYASTALFVLVLIKCLWDDHKLFSTQTS